MTRRINSATSHDWLSKCWLQKYVFQSRRRRKNAGKNRLKNERSVQWTYSWGIYSRRPVLEMESRDVTSQINEGPLWRRRAQDTAVSMRPLGPICTISFQRTDGRWIVHFFLGRSLWPWTTRAGTLYYRFRNLHCGSRKPHFSDPRNQQKNTKMTYLQPKNQRGDAVIVLERLQENWNLDFAPDTFKTV